MCRKLPRGRGAVNGKLAVFAPVASSATLATSTPSGSRSRRTRSACATGPSASAFARPRSPRSSPRPVRTNAAPPRSRASPRRPACARCARHRRFRGIPRRRRAPARRRRTRTRRSRARSAATRGATTQRSPCVSGSPSEHDVDSREDQLKLRRRDATDVLGQHLLVDRDDTGGECD